MVFISKKMIYGKERYYLEQSVRLPDGRVKKYSIYLKEYTPTTGHKQLLPSYHQLLQEKIVNDFANFAGHYYQRNGIFTPELLNTLERRKWGYKEILKKLRPKQWQDIIDRFTVNFTYESNAIEGNSLTLKDVAIVLHEKRALPGKDLRDIYETINTRKAMALVFANKLKITEKDIIQLHTILMKDTEVPRGYKKIPNFLLGRMVETTPPENVGSEMKELIAWYHHHPTIHPLERAALFHGRFEHIHPFEDGNGRVGRLLINIILVTNGYPPLIIRKTQRVAYLHALAAFDHGYFDRLKRFLIDKHQQTYQQFFEVYIRYI